MKKWIRGYLLFLLLVFLIPLLIIGIGNLWMKGQMDDSTVQNGRIFLPDNKITSYIKATNKVEEFDLEEYVKGVVAAEMPASFPEEALKAQAVAARSYIVTKAIANRGEDRVHQGAAVCSDSTHCLAWKSEEEAKKNWGQSAKENWDKISKAVDDTKGEVVTYHAQPVSAVFCAVSGGRTESASQVWGGKDVPYLQSVDSPYDQLAPDFFTTVTLSAEEFKRKLETVNPQISLSDDPTQWVTNVTKTDGGGVETIQIGTAQFRGTEIRALFGLRSHYFDLKVENGQILFQVRGYGHGVGLSQWGAKGYAENGDDYKKILKRYYQGVELQKIKN